ncbi:MAG: ABC transporter permease [Gemmataceae bacterium]|nr:ABC transporter permease [Gemmataceae bacterium]
MSYSLSTLWHERQRYLPGILAVGFSALLIALQCGLLLGLFGVSSMPVDRNKADVWMGAPGVLSVDLGRPIREGYVARMAAQPEIERCEVYLQGFSYWAKKTGATELCMVIGSRLSEDSLGAIDALTPEHRALLTEPGTIVIDESDRERLGVSGIGDVAEVSWNRVKVVGMTKGVKSLAGPFVFCSINTARPLLRYLPDQVTYVIGKTRTPEGADRAVERLKAQYENITAFTAPSFSRQSQWHWLTKTKAGLALGYAALLGLLVGAVVTSQTLYAATAASMREFAVLRALGIPWWRMGAMVMSQAFWIGVIGITLALPALFGARALAEYLTVSVILPPRLLLATVAITLVMALVSGLAALRSLNNVEPATLLR